MFTANNSIHRPSSRSTQHGSARPSSHLFGSFRTRTPNMSDDGAMSTTSGQNAGAGEGVDATGEEDARTIQFREQFRKSEALLMAALGDGSYNFSRIGATDDDASAQDNATATADAVPASAPKKPARKIDEDDYGDDDDDDEDEDMTDVSPLKSRSMPNGVVTANHHTTPSRFGAAAKPSTDAAKADDPKSSEEIRKKLEQDKKDAEDAARRSNYTLFYTYETDRDAMLDQQKLDELDRQVEVESENAQNTKAGQTPQQGTLSSTNLGGSVNLTLKHLIARIDAKRSKVAASDAELRELLSDVRKNRSKWASEDKIGQEELYESMEKVLMELKAMTQWAGPFLQKVNKRDAPDYHSIIKNPMDIGSMMKKLKALQYKSKKEFVDDLMLIWSNCLKYNADPAHFLRKKALHMKKESEKLVPLIPEITIRDRAEVEAEERRLARGTETAEPEDSEDEEPIMASRGRKAPSKSSKGTTNGRKAPPEGTPKPDKPAVPALAGATSNLKNEFLRADSDAPDALTNGFTTPPPGSLTPLRPNGVFGSHAAGSQADISELDEGGNAVGGNTEDADVEDSEYKAWRMLTKKDRARRAAERHKLFRGDKHDTLADDQPALLRSKAGMRKILRRRQEAEQQTTEASANAGDGRDGVAPAAAGSLTDSIGEQHDDELPDYYDTVDCIPNIPNRLKWVEDSEGQVVDQSEEYLRFVPKGSFKAPPSQFSKKIDANMKQMQETRKIVAKIGIVKQMQIQAQTYQNQFQKYDPSPFVEQDIDAAVVSDEGPVMAEATARAALQRSVGKIFYHAGFEDFQPSALEAVTDVAVAVFENLGKTLKSYVECPKVKDEAATNDPSALKPRYTSEESILHALNQQGLDVEELEGYCKDDVDRMSTKLQAIHERMKAFLAELLRPALDGNAGQDGVGAFNDGSEQFVGGDFAEDLGEDFFGFRELGLDTEFGLTNLSVPLHLLQSRMYNAHQAQNANTVSTSGNILDEPPPFDPVTSDTIKAEVGLAQHFFYRKLPEGGDQPLVEDDNLPVKQRFPKPRLPPNGKISSPRKRPIREQQQMARKKRKLEEGKEDANANGAVKPAIKPIGKLKLDMPASKENIGDPEKDDASAVGMMSPESIAA